MLFKKRLFGYSVREVEDRMEEYQNLIDLQRRDIEFLKRDNSLLKTTLMENSRIFSQNND